MEAAAVGEVGLTLSEFYSLTFRRWQLIWERYCDREVRHERSANQLTTVYANVHRDKDKRPKPFTIEDFAPALRGAKPSQERAQSPLDQMSALKLHHEVLVARNMPAGAWGKLSQEELDELYAERHRPPPGSIH
jgi:hypothetical protein